MKNRINEVKETLKKKKTVLGSEQTLKAARTGNLAKVFMCSNCEEEVREDIKRFSEISGFELVVLSVSNHDLGTIAKKPFSISVIGVLK